MDANVKGLRQTFPLSAPSGPFTVSISLVSAKGGSATVDRGSSVAPAAEVAPGTSDVLSAADWVGGVDLDEDSSSLAKSVPLH
jgi:hypothetical protein